MRSRSATVRLRILKRVQAVSASSGLATPAFAHAFARTFFRIAYRSAAELSALVPGSTRSSTISAIDAQDGFANRYHALLACIEGLTVAVDGHRQ